MCPECLLGCVIIKHALASVGVGVGRGIHGPPHALQASGQQRGGGRMHKSADARRPDTPQAGRDILWLLAVAGCDVCHSHDG